MLTFITFFVILSILILVHEFGHYWVAKKAGIYVEEFGFGLPPRLFGFKYGETIYSINWLPFGGFVKLYGEEGQAGGKKPKGVSEKRAFYEQSAWVKLAVVCAGVTMNVMFAFLVFAGLYSVTGIPEEVDRVIVSMIQPDSPAAQSGIATGDKIVNIGLLEDEKEKVEQITETTQFIEFTKQHIGQQIYVDVVRSDKLPALYTTDGSEITGYDWTIPTDRVIMTPSEPEYDAEGNIIKGATGMIIMPVDNVFYPAWQMPFRGFWLGLKEAFLMVWLIITMLGGLLWTWVSTGDAPGEVSGPVGIYNITSQVVPLGWVAVLRFSAALSLNLAALNILPFPALDGGRLWFIVWEGVTGRKVKPQYEAWVHTIGMIILLSLLLLVTVNDVYKLLLAQEWFVNLTT